VTSFHVSGTNLHRSLTLPPISTNSAANAFLSRCLLATILCRLHSHLFFNYRADNPLMDGHRSSLWLEGCDQGQARHVASQISTASRKLFGQNAWAGSRRRDLCQAGLGHHPSASDPLDAHWLHILTHGWTLDSCNSLVFFSFEMHKTERTQCGYNMSERKISTCNRIADPNPRLRCSVRIPANLRLFFPTAR
jgi:hypothetical protein